MDCHTAPFNPSPDADCQFAVNWEPGKCPSFRYFTQRIADSELKMRLIGIAIEEPLARFDPRNETESIFSFIRTMNLEANQTPLRDKLSKRRVGVSECGG